MHPRHPRGTRDHDLNHWSRFTTRPGCKKLSPVEDSTFQIIDIWGIEIKSLFKSLGRVCKICTLNKRIELSNSHLEVNDKIF